MTRLFYCLDEVQFVCRAWLGVALLLMAVLEAPGARDPARTVVLILNLRMAAAMKVSGRERTAEWRWAKKCFVVDEARSI